MKIDILTLFPEMFASIFSTSILGRAQKSGLIQIELHNLRDWAADKHRTVDDTPYGGGAGMVIKIEVVDRALFDLKSKVSDGVRYSSESSDKSQKSKLQRKIQNKLKPHVILMTPQGKPFSQALAQKLAKKRHLILITGHYEGFDERIRALVDDEISIGDYVVTGGELPAMVITDAVARLLPGVLGKDISSHEDSFSSFGIRNSSLQSPKRLLEYPHYTRPEVYTPISYTSLGELSVPEILKKGYHAKIQIWRQAEALKRTQKRRPDLLK